MKNHLNQQITHFLVLALSLLIMSTGSIAQELTDQNKELKPVRNMFESIWLIDNQTVVVPVPGTFEFDMQHRFGTVENGYEDYFGFAANSNIRLGFNYVPIKNLQIGFGITKERILWDFNAKYALVQQKKEGGFPLSISYYVNAGVDSRDGDRFEETSDRFSYFHQIMVARKVSNGVSIQVAPSLSYFNYGEPAFDIEGNPLGRLDNKHFALSALARIKISSATSVIINYDQPLSSHDTQEPESNLSFGIQTVSSSHAFQVFVGNFKSLSPQFNNARNQNGFGDGEILIGFNFTRLWNF